MLRVNSDYAQPITGQVTEVTCPVIGRAQPEITPARDRKQALASVLDGLNCLSNEAIEFPGVHQAPGASFPDNSLAKPGLSGGGVIVSMLT